MEIKNDDKYDYEEENPPSFLRPSNGWREKVSKKMLIAGGVAVVLIFLVVSAITKEDKKTVYLQPPPNDAVERMQFRVQRIEERIEQMEMQLTRLPALIHQVSNIEKGGDTGQIDMIAARIERLDKTIKEIQEETSRLKNRQQQVAAAPPQKPAPARVEARVETAAAGDYVIQKGDTLYSIARNNAIPLKTLLERNNLTEKSIIKPGDRLRLR
jgi:LysM repeat protein